MLHTVSALIHKVKILKHKKLQYSRFFRNISKSLSDEKNQIMSMAKAENPSKPLFKLISAVRAVIATIRLKKANFNTMVLQGLHVQVDSRLLT